MAPQAHGFFIVHNAWDNHGPDLIEFVKGGGQADIFHHLTDTQTGEADMILIISGFQIDHGFVCDLQEFWVIL